MDLPKSPRKRKAAFDKMKLKYPDHCLIVVQKAAGCTLPALKQQKYAVNKNNTMGSFMSLLRQQLSLSSIHALFLFVDTGKTPNGKSLSLCPMTHMLSQICKEYENQDGALYIWYQEEATFGSIF